MTPDWFNVFDLKPVMCTECGHALRRHDRNGCKEVTCDCRER